MFRFDRVNKLKSFFGILLLWIISYSCQKDKAPQAYTPTAADSVAKIVDSVKGKYRVLITKDSLPPFSPLVIETIGFDTIEVLKIGNDSIEVLNYRMAFNQNQILSGSWFLFSSTNENLNPPSNQSAGFYLFNDSIEFMDGYWGFEIANYLSYNGKKISE